MWHQHNKIMEQTNFSVGLDIGTTKIVALVGRKNEFNKVEILGVGEIKKFRCA